MANYQFTNKAVHDLTSIWNYTYRKWSEQQADNYYQLLIDQCENIALNPTIGRNYIHISANLFGYKVGKHIIFLEYIKK